MHSLILWFIIVFGMMFSAAVETGTGRYELYTEMVTYKNAVAACENKSKEILTLHTGEEFDEFLDWLPLLHGGKPQEKDIWVGLKQITGGKQEYAWVDDNSPLEKKPCWKDGEPSENSHVQCVYMDTNEDKLSTEICTNEKKLACYDPVSNTYTVIDKDVTFSAAAEECSKLGQHLPIVKTKSQRDRLKDVSQNYYIECVWIGLMEVDTNKYQWIDGDGLLRYKWENSEAAALVHGHRDYNVHFVLHAPTKPGEDAKPRPYVCQKRKKNRTLDNYYKFEAANAVMYLSHLNVFFILKRTECAVQCSRDTTCLQYTINGRVCKTYGKSLYWYSESYGANLFKRRIVSKYL